MEFTVRVFTNGFGACLAVDTCLAISICLALCTSQAFAQTPLPAQPDAPSPPQRAALPPRIEIRVNSNFNISEPIFITDKASLTELQTGARKVIYEIASKECKLLLETIARECRIESINVNSNVQNQNFRGDPSTLFLNTSANSIFRIVPKD
jgi:hypothetical protein